MIKSESGQALIIVIFALAFAIAVITEATVTAISLGKNVRTSEDAQAAYYVAESGLETALLKIERNPSLCSGSENWSISQNTVSVSYNLVSSTCTVTATSQSGTVIKKVQAQATIGTNSLVTTCCWKQIQ